MIVKNKILTLHNILRINNKSNSFLILTELKTQRILEIMMTFHQLKKLRIKFLIGKMRHTGVYQKMLDMPSMEQKWKANTLIFGTDFRLWTIKFTFIGQYSMVTCPAFSNNFTKRKLENLNKNWKRKKKNMKKKWISWTKNLRKKLKKERQGKKRIMKLKLRIITL